MPSQEGAATPSPSSVLAGTLSAVWEGAANPSPPSVLTGSGSLTRVGEAKPMPQSYMRGTGSIISARQAGATCDLVLGAVATGGTEFPGDAGVDWEAYRSNGQWYYTPRGGGQNPILEAEMNVSIRDPGAIAVGSEAATEWIDDCRYDAAISWPSSSTSLPWTAAAETTPATFNAAQTLVVDDGRILWKATLPTPLIYANMDAMSGAGESAATAGLKVTGTTDDPVSVSFDMRIRYGLRQKCFVAALLGDSSLGRGLICGHYVDAETESVLTVPVVLTLKQDDGHVIFTIPLVNYAIPTKRNVTISGEPGSISRFLTERNKATGGDEFKVSPNSTGLGEIASNAIAIVSAGNFIKRSCAISDGFRDRPLSEPGYTNVEVPLRLLDAVTFAAGDGWVASEIEWDVDAITYTQGGTASLSYDVKAPELFQKSGAYTSGSQSLKTWTVNPTAAVRYIEASLRLRMQAALSGLVTAFQSAFREIAPPQATWRNVPVFGDVYFRIDKEGNRVTFEMLDGYTPMVSVDSFNDRALRLGFRSERRGADDTYTTNDIAISTVSATVIP